MKLLPFVAVLCLVAPAFAAQPASTPATAEEEVRHLNIAEVDAFIKNDRAVLDKLWSSDFVVTNPLNKFVTKQQVLGMIDSGMLAIPTYERQIEYVKVYGDFVIVAGGEKLTFAGKMPNAGKPQYLRFTGVWMKQGDRWQEIARHANIVPES